MKPRLLLLWLCLLALAAPALAQAPVEYHLTFPEPEHRWMLVEVTFPDLPDAPLQARMSRSSPGRYALHEFAKNVFGVRARDGAGRPLALERPNPHQWDVGGHDGTVRVAYRIYGDRVDGTFLAVDSTHAHINMPAALMWARGLEDRPATVRLERPAAGADWRVATQLYPTADPLVFTAPNLQYLMDSPIEFSAFALRTFEVPDPGAGGRRSFRIALHHEGSAADADRFAAEVERFTREQGAIFGGFPDFEPGAYTYIADYLPYASGDGMEHRNSTILTSPASLRDPGQRRALLNTAAHELFHAWNVERIRPASLEPFDFEEANMSAELWLAEGFTTYYAPLSLRRAGLLTDAELMQQYASMIGAVAASPAREFRSVVDMSRLAPFVDAAQWTDRTNWENTFISYYTWGAAIALGLDLSLRRETGGRVTLDEYMRALWRRHGRPAGPAPGLVAAPYTMRDARDRLAEISSRRFADDFFDRYIEGRKVVDFEPLLAEAGFVLRRPYAARAWTGDIRLGQDGRGARVLGPVPFGSPAHAAGLAQDDVVVRVAAEAVTSAAGFERVIGRHRPGDRIPIAFLRRGREVRATLVLSGDPRIEIVPAEAAGVALTPARRAFREAWLESKVAAAATSRGPV